MGVFLINLLWAAFATYLWVRTSKYYVKTTPRGGGPRMTVQDQARHHYRQYVYYKELYEIEKSSREYYEAQCKRYQKEEEEKYLGTSR